MTILMISFHFSKNSTKIGEIFRLCCSGPEDIRNSTAACSNFNFSPYGYCSKSDESLYSLKGLYFKEIMSISLSFLVYIVCLYFYHKVTYFMLYREGKIRDLLNDNSGNESDSSSSDDYNPEDDNKATFLDYIGERRISLRQAYNRRRYISYCLYGILFLQIIIISTLLYQSSSYGYDLISSFLCYSLSVYIVLMVIFTFINIKYEFPFVVYNYDDYTYIFYLIIVMLFVFSIYLLFVPNSINTTETFTKCCTDLINSDEVYIFIYYCYL